MSRDIFKIYCTICGWKGDTSDRIFWEYNIEFPEQLEGKIPLLHEEIAMDTTCQGEIEPIEKGGKV